MLLEAEVTDRMQSRRSCDGLLYTPLGASLTYESSRRYTVDFEGDRPSLEEFVRTVLVDETSQELHLDRPPARRDFALFLDGGMKPGALDLEKEAILRHYRDSGPASFTIRNLSIRRRIYIFSPEGEEVDPAPFIRDVFNPAIHTWEITRRESP